MRDAPWIEAAEKYGYPKEPEWPICPCCGKQCETVFYRGSEIIGCEECISEGDAWQAEECFPE